MRKGSVAAIAAAIILAATPQVYAAEHNEPKLAKTTAYTYGVGGVGDTTASGQKVREGLIATKKKYLGYEAYIWRDEVDENGEHHRGEFIGIFTCADTGGKGVKNGVIDVYRDNYKRCEKWMKDTKGYIWIQIVPGEG